MLTVPQWGSRGEAPVGSVRDEVSQKLKNFYYIDVIKIGTFPVIKCSFYCDFVINEYDVSINVKSVSTKTILHCATAASIEFH